MLGLAEPTTPLRRRLSARRAVVALGAAVVAATLVWLYLGSPIPSKPVTEAEARAYLDKAVRAGLARDFRTLCRLNGAAYNCETDLASGARATAPTAGPDSVDAFYAKAEGGNETPGWVLTVRGRDGLGSAYKTEVMVFRDHEAHLKAINIVWWSGNRLVLDGGEVQRPLGDTLPP